MKELRDLKDLTIHDVQRIRDFGGLAKESSRECVCERAGARYGEGSMRDRGRTGGRERKREREKERERKREKEKQREPEREREREREIERERESESEKERNREREREREREPDALVLRSRVQGTGAHASLTPAGGNVDVATNVDVELNDSTILHPPFPFSWPAPLPPPQPPLPPLPRQPPAAAPRCAVGREPHGVLRGVVTGGWEGGGAVHVVEALPPGASLGAADTGVFCFGEPPAAPERNVARMEA